MNPIIEKITAYKNILDKIENKKKELDLLNADLADIRAELCEEMTNEEIPSITHDGFTYSLVNKTKYSKVAGSEEQLFATLREQGLGDLIQENINAMRFNSAMNAEAENNGGDLPKCYEGIVNVYSFQDISKRKSSKKV